MTNYREKTADTLIYYIDRWNKIIPQEAIYNFKKLKKAELVDACEKIDWELYKAKDIRYFSFSFDEALQLLFDGNLTELKKHKLDKLRDRSQHPSNYRVLGFYELLETDGERQSGRFFLDKSLTYNKVIYWNDGSVEASIIETPSFILGHNKDITWWLI